MLGTVLVLVSCVVLTIQCLGFYEWIPLLSFSLFGQDSLLIYYVHACICKWGLPFAIIGVLLGVLALFDKTEGSELKKKMIRYGIFFVVLTLLSFL